MLQKKDGSLRFCVDDRRLDAKNVLDAYPLARIDDCLESLGDAEIFTILDCNAGYWQVPAAPEDCDRNTFTSYLGNFRYTRVPFGSRSPLGTFQYALGIILSGFRRQSGLIYLDNLIAFSRTTEEHSGHVEEILTLLRRAGISLKLTKCSFFQPKVDYLGHVITPGKLSVAPENTKSFAHAHFPRNTTQLHFSSVPPTFMDISLRVTPESLQHLTQCYERTQTPRGTHPRMTNGKPSKI